MRAQAKPPWPGAGKASQRSSDEVLSAARGCSVEERGLSFRVLDLPHLGAVTDAADLEKRTRISKLTDVELDAWVSDRSLQPSRVGMSRAERELLVMRVRKLPCDAEAAECALDAFTADARGPSRKPLSPARSRHAPTHSSATRRGFVSSTPS